MGEGGRERRERRRGDQDSFTLNVNALRSSLKIKLSPMPELLSTPHYLLINKVFAYTYCAGERNKLRFSQDLNLGALNYGPMLLQLSQWTSGRGAEDRMGHTHSLILRLELKAFTVICIKLSMVNR